MLKPGEKGEDMRQDGIDLSQSGWENPEGFKPRERDNTPAPAVAPVCGAKSPDGWECELPPGPHNVHKADDGSNGGLMWATDQVSNQEPRDRIMSVLRDQGYAVDHQAIHAIATDALRAETPAAWVRALDKIREMTK